MTRTVLITGASRGIGAATARLAAAGGYDVAVNYLRSRAEAESVVAEVIAAGQRGVAVQADVSDPDAVTAMFSAVDEAFGALDALVVNAGILEGQMRVDQMTADRIDRVFAANVRSAFLCCGEAVRRMSTRHGGRGGAIVNVSSAAARLGGAREYVDYAASKGAIDTLTVGLAAEVADEGIRVNAVRPGFIYTDIHASGGEPGRVDRLKDNIPMKRGGQPEEVAKAVLWLLSEESSFTTGAFIEAAGGR